MSTFEKYFGKSDAELNVETKNLCFRKVQRGFEAAIDAVEVSKIQLEEEIEAFRIAVANGDTESIPPLANALMDMAAAVNTIQVLRKEEDEFVGSNAKF